MQSVGFARLASATPLFFAAVALLLSGCLRYDLVPRGAVHTAGALRVSLQRAQSDPNGLVVDFLVENESTHALSVDLLGGSFVTSEGSEGFVPPWATARGERTFGSLEPGESALVRAFIGTDLLRSDDLVQARFDGVFRIDDEPVEISPVTMTAVASGKGH